MDNYTLLQSLTDELESNVLNPIHMMELDDEWSDFYHLIPNTEEFYTNIIYLQFSDAKFISKTQAMEIIELLKDVYYIVEPTFLIQTVLRKEDESLHFELLEVKKKIDTLIVVFKDAFLDVRPDLFKFDNHTSKHRSMY